MQDNPYVPQPAEILEVFPEAPEIKTFTLRFSDNDVRRRFDYKPGQFVQLSIPGVGEAPISVTSSPTFKKGFKLCVERKGRVTDALFDFGEGSEVLVRGPYGNGFPFDEVKGKNILFVGGGIGLAPLRSAIYYARDFREDYGEVQIFYGDKTSTCLLFIRDFSHWEECFDLDIICEKSGPEWTGKEGVVTDLLEEVNIDIENAVTFACGPPIMYKFLVPELEKMGFSDEDIHLSYERRMECGFGKCRRCNVGDKLVCKDGPVFSLDEVREYMDKET
ncbi:MAG: FAD/NAD(P)-binding protein [Hadesarchaea archaeon]|nr:FAD/NAD(P)-binding protein [Hadesarchaea archaeon]